MIAMRRCYAISIIGMEGKNMNHNKKNRSGAERFLEKRTSSSAEAEASTV